MALRNNNGSFFHFRWFSETKKEIKQMGCCHPNCLTAMRLSVDVMNLKLARLARKNPITALWSLSLSCSLSLLYLQLLAGLYI